MQKPLLKLLTNPVPPPIPPIWLMRQAGRYLPEYCALRSKAGGFLNLCYSPEMAEEVTLQPIRRYGFDAAILFADILLLPQALGQKLWFDTGNGPRLTPISSGDMLNPDDAAIHLAPVMQTLDRLTRSLPAETTLIGFAGAPWTVASYMVAGRSTPDQEPARWLAINDKPAFQSIIDKLVAASIDYLAAQIKAGAEIVQLFESWAGSLQGADFEHWCITPVMQIIEGLRAQGLKQPVICFPRGACHDMGDYVARTKCQILGLDSAMDRHDICEKVSEEIVLQGNLDPQCLVAGGAILDAAVEAILRDFEGRRFVFNLGHGVVPQTPPKHVAQLVRRVRQTR